MSVIVRMTPNSTATAMIGAISGIVISKSFLQNLAPST